MLLVLLLLLLFCSSYISDNTTKIQENTNKTSKTYFLLSLERQQPGSTWLQKNILLDTNNWLEMCCQKASIFQFFITTWLQKALVFFMRTFHLELINQTIPKKVKYFRCPPVNQVMSLRNYNPLKSRLYVFLAYSSPTYKYWIWKPFIPLRKDSWILDSVISFQRQLIMVLPSCLIFLANICFWLNLFIYLMIKNF